MPAPFYDFAKQLLDCFTAYGENEYTNTKSLLLEYYKGYVLSCDVTHDHCAKLIRDRETGYGSRAFKTGSDAIVW